MVGALSRAMLARDPYTHDHQQRVADLCVAIAIEMRLPRARREGLRLAALIHDIGKIALPAETLTKPTPLAEHETQALRGHVETGLTILGERRWPWAIERTLRQHHERLDGSGYPDGLRGDQISGDARILAVADTVEAMASDRPYRHARGLEAALAALRAHRGSGFDPRVVDACQRLFRSGAYRFPVDQAVRR
ncbi:MAG: HD domain-containing protein [Betaproteobacteria bacterium]|nr:HD domain-containing protein [Betaproteobacteria bacterium]